jgi:hypothetical protein
VRRVVLVSLASVLAALTIALVRPPAVSATSVGPVSPAERRRVGASI